MMIPISAPARTLGPRRRTGGQPARFRWRSGRGLEDLHRQGPTGLLAEPDVRDIATGDGVGRLDGLGRGRAVGADRHKIGGGTASLDAVVQGVQRHTRFELR